MLDLTPPAAEPSLLPMRAIIKIEMALEEPSVDSGFVTWMDVKLMAEAPDEEIFPIGHARLARIHVGEAINAQQRLYDVLDADSAELEALYAVFFDDDAVHDRFAAGAGLDVLYIDAVTLEDGWRDRNIDLAVVRRVCDSVGAGCEIAVIEVASDAESAQWERMGFQRAPSEAGRFLYLPLAMKQARVVETEDRSAFKVVPNPAGRDEVTH